MSASADFIADRNGDRDRHAAFAGRTEGRTHERIDGRIEIGIGHHDQ